MAPDVRPIEQDVTPARGIDSSNKFDPRLVADLPLLKQLRGVAPTVSAVIDLLVTFVADEHQIVDAVQPGCVDSLMPSWALAAEGPNVSALCDVDLLLRYGRLP